MTPLGAGVLSLFLKLARCTDADLTIWPNATTTVTINLQVSYDGGVTYKPAITTTSAGGKSPFPFTRLGFVFEAPPTHVKGTIVVAGGPLVTSAEIWVVT